MKQQVNNLTVVEKVWHDLMYVNLYTRSFHLARLFLISAALLFVLKVRKAIGA